MMGLLLSMIKSIKAGLQYQATESGVNIDKAV
jgi:hypothetical protein